MLVNTLTLLARHAGAAALTLAAVWVAWLALWTGVCLALALLGSASFSLYLAGTLLAPLVVCVALVFPVVPSVLISERLTGRLGKARYIVQLPLVAGLVALGAGALLIGGLACYAAIGPLPLAYMGMAAVMALPVAGIYWLVAKTIEFGLDSVRHTLTLLGAGLSGFIELAALLRRGEVVPRPRAPAGTPGSTPSPGPTAQTPPEGPGRPGT